MNTEEECQKGNCIDRDFILSSILLIISKLLPYVADSLIFAICYQLDILFSYSNRS